MNSSKLAIATRSNSNINNITNITHKIIHNYACKCNADFIILEKPYIFDCKDPLGIYHYRIMYLYNLLDKYDRILMLDSDLLINKNCPNLFKEIPRNTIGTIFEDKGTRRAERIRRIKEIQSHHGYVDWEENYINTGVFMVSKEHKEIFNPNIPLWCGEGLDDVHLGYQIYKNRFDICELPYQYNHMTMFSEPWNNNANRFNSAIIHYAGQGKFDNNILNREEQIRKDYGVIYDN